MAAMASSIQKFEVMAWVMWHQKNLKADHQGQKVF
jgi:hypothetical protein